MTSRKFRRKTNKKANNNTRGFFIINDDLSGYELTCRLTPKHNQMQFVTYENNEEISNLVEGLKTITDNKHLKRIVLSNIANGIDPLLPYNGIEVKKKGIVIFDEDISFYEEIDEDVPEDQIKDMLDESVKYIAYYNLTQRAAIIHALKDYINKGEVSYACVDTSSGFPMMKISKKPMPNCECTIFYNDAEKAHIMKQFMDSHC